MSRATASEGREQWYSLFFRQTILSITIVGVLLVTGGAQPTRPVKKNQGLPAKVKG
jgi:hypothetical protein